MKVLIIENHPGVADALERVYLPSSLKTEAASSASKAVDIILKNNLDLIVCNVLLPDLNGFDLMEGLEKIKIVIPTIFISSFENFSEEGRNKNLACFAGFFLKPFHLEPFREKVEEILKKPEK